MNRRVPMVMAMLGLALGGCAAASVPWRHPSLPQEQWGRDYAACRRLAERDSGWREDGPDSPFRDYDRQQAKRRADASANLCMTGLGYVPARSERPGG